MIRRLWGNLRAVGAAFEMTLRQNVFDGFILFTVLVQPLVIALLGLWILQDKGGSYAIFVVIGSGLTGLWSSLLFISGNGITWERWTGTLEVLVAAPTSLSAVVFGKTLASVLQSLLSMIVAYILAAWLFGLSLSIALPLPFAFSLVMTMVSFVAFGMIIAPIFVANPGIQGWQNAMEFPVYILAGFLFPIALLPGWTTPVSYVLAPYWAARALHDAAEGSSLMGDLWLSWGMMLLFAVLYFLIARFLFRVVSRKARVDGTLGLE